MGTLTARAALARTRQRKRAVELSHCSTLQRSAIHPSLRSVRVLDMDDNASVRSDFPGANVDKRGIQVCSFWDPYLSVGKRRRC
jgi:hypothetical protein